MKNPGYFPECDRCIKYNVDLPLEITCVDQIREKIERDVITSINANSPGARELSEKYTKCIQCLSERYTEEGDKKFLKEIGIDSNSLYTPKSQEE